MCATNPFNRKPIIANPSKMKANVKILINLESGTKSQYPTVHRVTIVKYAASKNG